MGAVSFSVFLLFQEDFWIRCLGRLQKGVPYSKTTLHFTVLAMFPILRISMDQRWRKSPADVAPHPLRKLKLIQILSQSLSCYHKYPTWVSGNPVHSQLVEVQNYMPTKLIIDSEMPTP